MHRDTQCAKEAKEISKSNQTQVKVYNASAGKLLNPNSFMPIVVNLDTNFSNRDVANTVSTNHNNGKLKSNNVVYSNKKKKESRLWASRVHIHYKTGRWLAPTKSILPMSREKN